MKRATTKFLIFLFIPLCVLQAGLIFLSIRKSVAIPEKELSTQGGAQLPFHFSETTSKELNTQEDVQLPKEEEKKQDIEQVKEEVNKTPFNQFSFFRRHDA